MSNALVNRMAAFEHGLEDAGWTAGKNLKIDIRLGAAEPSTDIANMHA